MPINPARKIPCRASTFRGISMSNELKQQVIAKMKAFRERPSVLWDSSGRGSQSFADAG
jgi:hypothetical protein